MYSLTANILASVANRVANYGDRYNQFQALFDEVDVQYGDLLYFCEVHWLSRGAVLSRVCDLQKEIATFLRQKNLPYADQFFDPRWFARLALLTDITAHLNAINVDPDTCVSVVASLREEFASRFAGVRPLAADFKLFTAPSDFPVDGAPAVGGATVQ